MTDEIKRKIKLARAQGLLMGFKDALELSIELDWNNVINLINEVLELIDDR